MTNPSTQPIDITVHINILKQQMQCNNNWMTEFPSNRSQQVMVDGCRSKLVNVVSGVPQGSVLGPLLFLLYTLELFYILENKLIGYADDSTLMAVLPSQASELQ